MATTTTAIAAAVQRNLVSLSQLFGRHKEVKVWPVEELRKLSKDELVGLYQSAMLQRNSMKTMAVLHNPRRNVFKWRGALDPKTLEPHQNKVVYDVTTDDKEAEAFEKAGQTLDETLAHIQEVLNYRHEQASVLAYSDYLAAKREWFRQHGVRDRLVTSFPVFKEHKGPLRAQPPFRPRPVQRRRVPLRKSLREPSLEEN
eukprot:RCo053883